MRIHTSEFKEEIKRYGRQIQGKITYYPSYDLVSESEDNILTESDLQIISEQANYNDPTEIDAEDIFSISIIKNGDLLQSLMKEFDFETKIELNIGSVVNPQFGLLVNETYEYLDYGNYIVNSKEFNMDTETWSYICYDKMLFSMIKYRGLKNIEYPITIKQFINKLCDKVGLEFEDSDFVNQNQLIYEDLYKDRDVTYRDIFDEISKIVAGNLLINDDDKLEVGYVNLTSESLLPSEYTQVDYIESTGTQYIDTTYIPTNNTKWVLDAQFTTIATTQYNGRFENSKTPRGQRFDIAISGDYFYTNGGNNTQASLADTNRHTFIVDMINQLGYVDDNDYSLSIQTFNSERPVYLFARKSNNIEYYCNEKIYNCKFYENDVLTMDLIPCYRNSDDEVGLYDLINNVFYTNQGTGTFNYGEIVVDTINEDYLKDTNVRMSEKIGVINSVAILDSDSNLQYLSEDTQSIKENEMTRITITDNLIAMNGETQEIADNILNKLNGLYYYANDLQTTGVCYYDFLDMFNVEARGNTYQCLLLNNEITITQGIEEHIFTEKFEEIETSKEEYTTSVMTNKQASLKIDQQEAKIEARVEKDGIISAINLSPEEIQIEANKISLEGKEINLTSDSIVIESTNFSVDEDGKITATAGDIGGFLTTNKSFSKSLYGLYNYNYFDMTLVAMYVLNRISLDTNLINILDANNSGDVLASDYVTIKNIIEGTTENTKEVEGTFALNSDDPKNCLVVKDKNDEIISSIGVGGINSTYIICDNFVCGKTGNTFSDFTGATINGNTGNITCVSLTQTSKKENKKNFEKLTNAKDILNQVDIYKYNFKDEDDNVKKSIGFVIGDDFNYSEEITSTNNDGANIYSMVSVLWQVVKEQQEEINQLKEMIKYGKY